MPFPFLKTIEFPTTSMLWALRRVYKKALSVSTAQVVLLEVTPPNWMFPLSAKVNLKSNWLQPDKENTPSDTFSLIPALGSCNLNFPLNFR